MIFFTKLKKRYKLIILHDDTSTEKVSFAASLWVLVVSVFCLFLFVIIISVTMDRLTSTNNAYSRNDLLKAYIQIDSLEHIAKANDAYLLNLKNVMDGTAGETMAEAEKRDNEFVDANPDVLNPASSEKPTLSDDERVLRDLLVSGSSIGNQTNNEEMRQRGIASYTFYRPVNGMLSSGFDEKTRHFAIDIATKMNEPIKATLDGHVILASFTPATGYVIVVQHANNLVSIYKHCAALLKKDGSFVRGGEVIALAGSTGELTTGPHLHFELWHNGSAVNAENYIKF